MATSLDMFAYLAAFVTVVLALAVSELKSNRNPSAVMSRARRGSMLNTGE